MQTSQNWGFAPSIYPQTESAIVDFLQEYNRNPDDSIVLNNIIRFSRNFPEQTVYQILSRGEFRLMKMPFYFESYIRDEKLADALKLLFQNSFSLKTIFKILRIHKELLLKNPDLITPKSIFIGFKKNSIELFSICIGNMLKIALDPQNYSKCYRLFIKIYQDIDQVHLSGPQDQDLLNFHARLSDFPDDFLVQLEQIDIFRISSNFVFWDNVERLNRIVSLVPEIVFFMPENGTSLLNFATKWESIECLDFLLDLVHEIAIIELIPGVLSPYAYAVAQQNPSVLAVYEKHGFNRETIITIDSIPIMAAEFAKRAHNITE